MSLAYTDYPVASLISDISNLSQTQQQYAVHLALAAWAGQIITMKQVSVSSAPILQLVRKYLKIIKHDINKLQNLDVQVQNYFHEYILQFFYQSGDFSGYGDEKFIPRCDMQQLKKYLSSVQSTYGFENDLVVFLQQCQTELYEQTRPILNFAPAGRTAYYSEDISKIDVTEIDKILQAKGIMFENNLIYHRNNRYEVLIASIQKKEIEIGSYQNEKIVLVYGHFSEDLAKIVPHLRNAQKFCSELQKKMLEELILFYEDGDMKHHLEYSKLWVEDANPTIETYQGFIETYRDPQGVRAEMESFVAFVDPLTSQQLEKLLEPIASKVILGSLPVPSYLQKSTFVPPTYKAIDILAFPSSGLPIGINIPNYDSIRNHFGFKNVSLQNVIAARYNINKPAQYLSQKVDAYLKPINKHLCDIEVALHELFGHGSCRTLTSVQIAALNAEEKKHLRGPGYSDSDTFTGIFKELQSPFEECRAEVTAHFLVRNTEVQKIFGMSDAKKYEIGSAYSIATAGILGLMQYNEETAKWTQAHSQANHLIFRWCQAHSKCITIEILNNDLLINVDESKLPELTKVLGDLVYQLNVLKSSAAVNESNELFSQYTEVSGAYAKIREIAIANKRPRMVVLCPKIVKKDNIFSFEGVSANVLDGCLMFEENWEAAGL